MEANASHGGAQCSERAKMKKITIAKWRCWHLQKSSVRFMKCFRHGRRIAFLYEMFLKVVSKTSAFTNGKSMFAVPNGQEVPINRRRAQFLEISSYENESSILSEYFLLRSNEIFINEA